MHDTEELPEFEPLERSSLRLADFVHEQLLKAIASGSLAPGIRLVQGAIADQMNVSRTPVREALLRLEREKVLESVDRGGFIVRSVDADDARNVYEVRKAIEGHAARLVAESAEASDIVKRLEPLVVATEDWSPGGDLRDAFARNDALHRKIVTEAANPVLIEAFDLVWARSQSFVMYAAFIALVETEGMTNAESGPGHRDILAAISKGNGDNAQKLMMDHIAAGLELQIEALERS